MYRTPVNKELSRKCPLSTSGHSTNFVMRIECPATAMSFSTTVSTFGFSDQSRHAVYWFCYYTQKPQITFNYFNYFNY